MKKLSIILALFPFLILTDIYAEENRMSVAQKASEMIARFEQGKLRPGFDAGGVRADKSTSGLPIISSGPLVMIDPVNVKENAPVVELNGKDLAELGFGIYPQAFALLDHKAAYMRIIGASALNSICGLKVEWIYLQSPWDSNGAQTEWALESKRIWISWYAERLASEIQTTKKKAESGRR